MKIVYNDCYGEFGLTDFACNLLGVDKYKKYETDRCNEELVKAIEDYGSQKIGWSVANLKIAVIPDEATDWRIEEHGGWETVWYVLDGKMHCVV